MEKEIAFVAYSSRDEQLAAAIFSAVRSANAKPIPVKYEPWPYNDIPGAPVNSPILERIDESAFIVADISYLNLNVVFEIGVAIGKQKRVFLTKSKSVNDDKALASETGIFDTLGYFVYESERELQDRLESQINATSSNATKELDRRAPIYVVDPLTRNEPVTVMTSRLKKAGYRYRSFNPVEDVRMSSSDAVRQVSASSGILMCLQEEHHPGARAHNVRTMFVAGLAEGMAKPSLLLAPENFVTPMDVRDSTRLFRDERDISNQIASFCPLVTDYLQESEPKFSDSKTLLQSLKIGDPTAENEMTTLADYYLKTDQYQRAARGDVNLVVGRKGAGKTALFIQLRNKMRSNKRNVVVDLKPEGYQLIKLKEDVFEYVSDGARTHLITAFWEYLILLEVAYKLLEKDKTTYKHNHEINSLYLELESTYKDGIIAEEGDFSERLLVLSRSIASEYKSKYGLTANRRLTTEEVTELLHSFNIRLLKEKIASYLNTKEAVWVLFDNLDKGWSTQGVDVVDAVVLRCLIDAGRKLEREFRKSNQKLYCIIFVRNDVYEHVMLNSADYGKEMRAILDWTDADLLREMLRLRLEPNFDKSQDLSFERIWRTICVSHFNGEETSAYLIDRSLMRPRNLLKIFNHALGSAINFNRQRISEEDLTKGLAAYSQDLIIELDRELTDVFPQAADLLFHFIDAPSLLNVEDIGIRVLEAGLDEADVEQVIDFLLYYGVLGIYSDEASYIYDNNYNLKLLKIRADRTNSAVYTINPAFWPALNVKQASEIILPSGANDNSDEHGAQYC